MSYSNTLRGRMLRRLGATILRLTVWNVSRNIRAQLREEADALAFDAGRHFASPTTDEIQRKSSRALVELTRAVDSAVLALMAYGQVSNSRKVQRALRVEVAKALDLAQNGALAVAVNVPGVSVEAVALLTEAAGIVARVRGFVLCRCEQCEGEYIEGTGSCAPCCDEHAAEAAREAALAMPPINGPKNEEEKPS